MNFIYGDLDRKRGKIMWPFKSKSSKGLGLNYRVTVPANFSLILTFQGTHPLNPIHWKVAINSKGIVEISDNIRKSVIGDLNRKHGTNRHEAREVYPPVPLEGLVDIINEQEFFSLERKYDLPVSGAGIAKLQVTMNDKHNHVEVRGTDRDLMRKDMDLARFLRIWDGVISYLKFEFLFEIRV